MPFKNSEALDPTNDKRDLCETGAIVGTLFMRLRRIGGGML